MVSLNRSILISLLALNLNALTLDEALDTALKNSTELKKVSMNRDIAKNDLAEKRSANFGSIDVVSSYTHYNIERTLTPIVPSSLAPGSVVATTKDLVSFGVTYNVNLFSGFADIKNIKIANIQKDIVTNLYSLTKEQIAYNVKSIYIKILSLKAQRDAQDLYVKALEELHKDISLKVKLGNSAKIDELKSLAEVSRAKSKLFDIKSNITILKESLASVMMVDKVDDLSAIDIDIDDKFLKDLELYKSMLKDTKRVKIASLEIEKKTKIKEKAQSIYYPHINFSGYYGENSDANSLDDQKELWQAGINLRWNLFDFGKKRAMLQKSEITLMQSKLDKQRVFRDLQKSLVEAINKIQRSVQDYNSANSELNLMTQTQKIEQIRYDNGASDINDLLSTKARYQMAKSQVIAAKYSYQDAINYLDYILEKGITK